jgi:hypothetical protein
LALIVPSSQLVKRNKAGWRSKTLKNNSLKAVVSFPAELFQPYAAANTAFIVLEKGIPHTQSTKTFFCRIENDGYTLKKSVRVEKDGEQLSQAIAAYHAGDSVPGFCITTAIDPADTKTEWFPGVFIKSRPHPETELRAEISILIRSLISFAAIHAPELVAFEQLIATGVVQHRPYRGRLARLRSPETNDGYHWPADVPRKLEVKSFVKLYELNGGYAACQDAKPEKGFEKIAIYANDSGDATHVAKQTASGKWTSKLGDWEDIEHSTLESLEGDFYGKVVQILKREVK